MRKDIGYLIQIVEENKIFDVDFNDYDRVYPYTTENLSGYLPNLEGKKVLSVAGSGDHYLNSALLGASKIDSFDINLFAIYFLKLKKAAVQALSYEEFFDFMNNHSLDYLDRILTYLDEDSRKFWNFYILAYSFPSGILSTSLFFPKLNEEDFSRRNLYFHENEYQTLKRNLDNHSGEECYHTDVYDLPEFLHDTYDYIFLSNIVSYQSKLQAFKELVLKLKDSLTDEGSLYYGYYYNGQGSSYPYFLDTIEGTRSIGFPSILYKGANTDKVLVLQK